MMPPRVRLAVAAALLGWSAFGLNVVYDKRTPESHRKWADGAFIRERMEVAARRICKALYGDAPRANLHEDFTMILHLAPVKGGNPAFASGRRITWKVGENPKGVPGMGLLIHEMTHVLDMGSDRVFTEAMADWVRYYKVDSSPSIAIDKRYSALRGARRYGKYAAGANFIDFMTQNYGEGTIYKILLGYREHGGKVWEKLYGKTFDGLVAEWRQMETIYDPVFQWTANGSDSGKVRYDGKFCPLRSVATEPADDRCGGWLNGASAAKVNNLSGGDMSIAFHGRFPKADKTAIASLGTAREKGGKALLLSATGKAGVLAAHVIADVPGRGCQIVSTTSVPLSGPAGSAHSVVIAVKGGDTAAIVVDGRGTVKIDMKTKCSGCVFIPSFAVGGMNGGLPPGGFAEPRGVSGVLLDDVRVFSRTFRSRETLQYATAFNADYRAAAAVTAKWCGRPGDGAIDDTKNWYCHNSIGERVYALPSKDTDVLVDTKSIPSIPPKAKFACKSFTIDGLAIADEANIDLRGVRIVDLADNTLLVTRNKHGIAVNALRAARVRLDGTLAVTAGMNITGGLEMREGSVLRLPADYDKARVKTVTFKGDGPVVLKPGAATRRGHFQRLMRIDELPKDLSRFRLNLAHEAGDAEFKGSADGKCLGVTPKKADE